VALGIEQRIEVLVELPPALVGIVGQLHARRPCRSRRTTTRRVGRERIPLGRLAGWLGRWGSDGPLPWLVVAMGIIEHAFDDSEGV
jgi:hypothetical protein